MKTIALGIIAAALVSCDTTTTTLDAAGQPVTTTKTINPAVVALGSAALNAYATGNRIHRVEGDK